MPIDAQPKQTRQRGFTLIELLVCIGVVAVLFALLLPAVQQVRQSAARTQCISNLRQIGLAIHQYESVHTVFPGIAGQMFWQTQIAPFLEQPLTASDSAILICPSDEFGELGGNYTINDGLWAADSRGFARNGYWRVVRVADVTDGLSNTAAFSERLSWPDYGGLDMNPDLFPEHWNRRIRKTAGFVGDLNAFADECRNHALFPEREWTLVGYYNHVMPPNQNSCFNGDPFNSGGGSSQHSAITATSQHRGGVNLLMADGSVRFTANDVDINLWRAFATRNGNESF